MKKFVIIAAIAALIASYFIFDLGQYLTFQAIKEQVAGAQHQPELAAVELRDEDALVATKQLAQVVRQRIEIAELGRRDGQAPRPCPLGGGADGEVLVE